MPPNGGAEPGCWLRRGRGGAVDVHVLLGVGPADVAVLEVDAEVFDGLAVGLGADPVGRVGGAPGRRRGRRRGRRGQRARPPPGVAGAAAKRSAGT